VEAVPVVDVPPPGSKLVRTGEPLAAEGTLAFAGADAVHRATRAVVAGRDAVVLQRRGPMRSTTTA
jgi:hypothetical protein